MCAAFKVGSYKVIFVNKVPGFEDLVSPVRSAAANKTAAEYRKNRRGQLNAPCQQSVDMPLDCDLTSLNDATWNRV